MNYFDLHCDTASVCYERKTDLNDKALAISAEEIGMFEKRKQTFAFFIRDEKENPFEYFLALYNDFSKKIEPYKNYFNPVFAVEGGALLEDKLERIEILKAKGIKFFSLCWNNQNLLASGVNAEGGITPLGKEAIKLLNKNKIALDLSHLNDEGFYEAIEIADKVLATHSNMREINISKRNITLDMARLIKEKNGLIGLCFYPEFSSEDIFDGIYQNIYLLLYKGFEDFISIGSDFDGCEMSPKLDKSEKVKDLYSYLLKRKIDKSILNKIFYDNANNFVANKE